MKDTRASHRYARALFELALAQQKLEETHEEFPQIVELVAKHPEINHLLLNTTIAREEKEDFLEKILPEKTSHLLLHFLKVLIRKRRFENLNGIQQKFQKLYEEKEGIRRVRVESAVELDRALKERLRLVLEKKWNRKVFLETEVNPGILGGLVLSFNGQQIDASFRTALLELKQRLVPQNA